MSKFMDEEGRAMNPEEEARDKFSLATRNMRRWEDRLVAGGLSRNELPHAIKKYNFYKNEREKHLLNIKRILSEKI